MSYMSIFEVEEYTCQYVSETCCSNCKTIWIFLSRDSILLLTKDVKRVGGLEFWYLLQSTFLTKFEKTFLKLMNIKKYFPWKFRINILKYQYTSALLLQAPKGDNDILSMFLRQVFKKFTVEKKLHSFIGNFNINCLE